MYCKRTVTATRGARQPTLSFMLLDQQGGAIQANVEARERVRFDNTLQINGTYTITGFGLQDTKRWMRTLPNHLTLILGRFTDLQPFDVNGFPAHHFNFAAYNEAAALADNNDTILTDYIGRVQYVCGMRQIGNATQKMVVWRDIILRNLEGNTLRFTLWSEKDTGFETGEYENAAKPTIMEVSSTYGGLQLSSTPATYYYLNPDVPETDYILSMYTQLVAPPVIQNVRTYRYDNIEQQKLQNRVTANELVREDPRNQMVDIITLFKHILHKMYTKFFVNFWRM